MMKMLVWEMFALIGATFLYAYISRHGLGRFHRIFAGLIVLGVIAMMGVTLFCCCSGGGCGSKKSCGTHASCGAYGNAGSCQGMKSDAACCKAKGAKSCKGGPGCMHHGQGMSGQCPYSGEGKTEIEKEVIIKDGDTTVTETRK